MVPSTPSGVPLQALVHQVTEDVAQHGWTVVGVFPTGPGQGGYFSYTAGLARSGRPDLYLEYADESYAELAAKVLDRLATGMVTFGPPEGGVVSFLARESGPPVPAKDLRLRLRPAQDAGVGEAMSFASVLAPPGRFDPWTVEPLAPQDWEGMFG